MTTTTTPTAGTDRTARRLAGLLAAPVAALATRLVLTQGLGVELRAGGPVSWASVLMAAFGAGAVGWLALVALERLGGNVRRRWVMIALAVLVLSLLGPLTEGATTAAGLGLATLHLVVAAVIIPAMAPSSR